MFAIIGIVIVFGAIVGGYLMEHGNLMVLVQPAELLIIGGAALGTVLIANPLSIIIRIGKGLIGVFMPSRFSKGFYLDHLKMLNELFQYARKHGAVKLEADIEEPRKSEVFKKYPKFLNNHHALHFVCDTLRMYISGGVGSFELDQMMELDMESAPRHRQRSRGSPLHRGGCAAWPGHCGGGAGRRHYHGLAGRAAGRDRAQSSGGARRDVSRHPAVLRLFRPSGI